MPFHHTILFWLSLDQWNQLAMRDTVFLLSTSLLFVDKFYSLKLHDNRCLTYYINYLAIASLSYIPKNNLVAFHFYSFVGLISNSMTSFVPRIYQLDSHCHVSKNRMIKWITSCTTNKHRLYYMASQELPQPPINILILIFLKQFCKKN